MTESGNIDENLECGYNVRAARNDYDDVLKDWMARSDSFRNRIEGRLDLAYGDAERQRLDIFVAAEGLPTLVYLHGGYWQRGDKSVYSFVAEPFVETGVNVVVMTYTLCPDTTVPRITDEVRSGLAWLYRHGGEHGLAAEHLNVAGHSAGGHLTAMMLATDWPRYGEDLPKDLVKSGIPISGLYDLAPLRHTSINELAGIDDAAARDCSPLFLEPIPGAPLLAVVGGMETHDFHEQAEAFVSRWSAAGARAELHVEPNVDHFDIVNRLANDQSELFRKTINLLI